MLIPPIALSFWLFSLPTPSDAQQLMTDMAAERAPLKVVTPEIVRVAQTFVTLPMGTERFVSIDGHRYAFVLEQHYHPPGFVGAPNGWHKGVTVYELRASSLSSAEPEPAAEPSQDAEAAGSEPGS